MFQMLTKVIVIIIAQALHPAINMTKVTHVVLVYYKKAIKSSLRKGPYSCGAKPLTTTYFTHMYTRNQEMPYSIVHSLTDRNRYCMYTYNRSLMKVKSPFLFVSVILQTAFIHIT